MVAGAGAGAGGVKRELAYMREYEFIKISSLLK